MEYPIKKLTKQIATKHLKDILEMLRLIPEVEYSDEDVLAEIKGDRILYGKWDHSFVVFDPKLGRPIAFLIAYERKAEVNDMYPINTLYLNEICVVPEYQRQGIAKELIRKFIDEGWAKGFSYLNGSVVFAVQTNSAEWNKRVQDMYLAFGFKKTGKKVYPNRVDDVFMLFSKKAK